MRPVICGGLLSSPLKDVRLGGYVALQYGSGVVKFRKVQIKPL